ncbi:unnamed protein product [Nippostrongylus brasiliensis]|uniref:Syndecan n=1 Tax=Nippostrongylus brasiliensis TaxID=27835 RepID=A0A0N4Y9L6_NIPBR|nr:unnamed protein product [Nippostrongylus brasiliensis]
MVGLWRGCSTITPTHTLVVMMVVLSGWTIGLLLDRWLISNSAVVGGTVVGLLTAILLVMFIVYRMRKKDEGSYALEEPKPRPYASYAYTKASTKEFYA